MNSNQFIPLDKQPFIKYVAKTFIPYAIGIYKKDNTTPIQKPVQAGH